MALFIGFKDNYDVAISRYKKLKLGEMTWSSSIRDHLKEGKKGKICIYCGADSNMEIKGRCDFITEMVALPLRLTAIKTTFRKLKPSADRRHCPARSTGWGVSCMGWGGGGGR